jgi:hypothetical protein
VAVYVLEAVSVIVEHVVEVRGLSGSREDGRDDGLDPNRPLRIAVFDRSRLATHRRICGKRKRKDRTLPRTTLAS